MVLVLRGNDARVDEFVFVSRNYGAMAGYLATPLHESRFGCHEHDIVSVGYDMVKIAPLDAGSHIADLYPGSSHQAISLIADCHDKPPQRCRA
jgi:hypothetical protein